MGTLLVIGLGYLWYLNFKDFFASLKLRKQRKAFDKEIDNILAAQAARNIPSGVVNEESLDHPWHER